MGIVVYVGILNKIVNKRKIDYEFAKHVAVYRKKEEDSYKYYDFITKEEYNTSPKDLNIGDTYIDLKSLKPLRDKFVSSYGESINKYKNNFNKTKEKILKNIRR